MNLFEQIYRWAESKESDIFFFVATLLFTFIALVSEEWPLFFMGLTFSIVMGLLALIRRNLDI